MVQLLLDTGADVNARSITYGNALAAASSRGHEKVVQLLLDNGAVPKNEDRPDEDHSSDEDYRSDED